jgi:hypothetical protein
LNDRLIELSVCIVPTGTGAPLASTGASEQGIDVSKICPVWLSKVLLRHSPLCGWMKIEAVALDGAAAVEFSATTDGAVPNSNAAIAATTIDRPAQTTPMTCQRPRRLLFARAPAGLFGDNLVLCISLSRASVAEGRELQARPIMNLNID